MDTYYGDEDKRTTLLKIEHSIFCHVRPSLEEEFGPWDGSKFMNSQGDFRIAEDIYNSLRSYENGKPSI